MADGHYNLPAEVSVGMNATKRVLVHYLLCKEFMFSVALV